jgi:TctA family transporter
MRERRWDLLWLGNVVLVGTLAMSAYSLWHGGHSIGYRHILVAAVVLAMLSAFAFERANRSLRGAALVILLVSSVTGFASFLIELDDQLLMRTWKEEPADVHANFYSELLYPWVQQHLR